MNFNKEIKDFIDDYTLNIERGTAAVFVGAGMSIKSGYPTWLEFVKPFIDEIDMDVKNVDLTKAIQFYINFYGREDINYAIGKAFDTLKIKKKNKNLNNLTKLPIKTYWTTNYDKELEWYFDKNNIKHDVKINKNNFTIDKKDCETILYKMHGDVYSPNEAIISKDDYDKYNLEREVFSVALKRDLVSKQFLFLGFGFNDPNIEHILSHVRLLTDISRKHYCIMKRKDQKSNQIYKRYFKDYGIHLIYIDDYGCISKILKKIRKKLYMRNIFISGSFSAPVLNWDDEDMDKLSFLLSESLVKSNFKIISGFGLGVGSNVINGALKATKKQQNINLDKYLLLKPFPQTGKNIEAKRTKYRKSIIKQSGICIFIFGNKYENGKIINANGMLEEFKIAKSYNKYIIPIGSTEGVSRKIWKEVRKNIDKYSYLKSYIDELGKEININRIIDIIFKIINDIKEDL